MFVDGSMSEHETHISGHRLNLIGTPSAHSFPIDLMTRSFQLRQTPMHKLKTLLAAFLTCSFTISDAAFAGEAVATATPTPVPIVAPPSDFFLHGYLGETIASKDYHYSHGINNGDLGPYYQTDVILFGNLYKGDGFINSVNLNVFTWYQITSHNEVPGSRNLRHWNEFDVNPQIDITFLKNFDLQVTSLNFLSPNNEFSNISEVEFQITYDDTSCLGPFALHPSFTYQKELVGNGAIESRGSLFEFILTPGIKLIKDGMFPTKVDFPLSVGLGDDRFYGGPTFGYFAATVTPTVGLGFIPKRYGEWDWTGAVSFFSTNDKVAERNRGKNQQFTFTTGIGLSF